MERSLPVPRTLGPPGAAVPRGIGPPPPPRTPGRVNLTRGAGRSARVGGGREEGQSQERQPPVADAYGATASRARARRARATSSGSAASIRASGPASAEVRAHHSSNDATRERRRQLASTATSARPGVDEQRAPAPRRRPARTARARPAAAPAGRAAALTASSTRPSQGLRARGPQHGDRHAAARPQHARISRGGAGRVGREHQALAAEHDVVGAVGLVDRLEVERRAVRDVVEPERPRRARGDRRSSRGRRRRPRPRRPAPTSARRREAGAARRRTRARARARPAAAPSASSMRRGEPGRPRVDVVGVLAPRGGDARPTCRADCAPASPRRRASVVRRFHAAPPNFITVTSNE